MTARALRKNIKRENQAGGRRRGRNCPADLKMTGREEGKFE